MEFNEFLGPEELEKEYKEFTFNLAGISFDISDYDRFCLTNKFDFNDVVINNLNRYFHVYLPKYISCFLNLPSETTSQFMIGVNDYGIVKGIPYLGELPIEKLKLNMYRIIYTQIRHESFINFCKYVKINFVKVNFNKQDIYKTIHPKFIKYLILKKKYDFSYQDFLLKYALWKEKFMFINRKLVDLVNNQDSREMLINYIKSIDPENPVIKLLLTDYKLESKTHDELISYKNKNNNPYYWVTRWKDEHREYIISQKPIFNKEFELKNTPYNLIQSISNMIPYWMTNNENMNLYVISIEIKSPINKNFEYFDEKWLCCHRKLVKGAPVCIINK